jgi:hypothetical protein
MNYFHEQEIIFAIKKLLSGRVNELLAELKQQIPLIEFTDYQVNSVISPVIIFSACEQTEKERIIKLETYTMTISFKFPETKECEFYCYAYSGVVGRVIYENPTLCGEVDRAVISGKKYISPKKPYNGEGWELTITLRLSVEGNTYAD